MTEHGGKRPGAGRPVGAASRANEEARVNAKAGGELPLDYMLRVMRDPDADITRRDDMAKAASPYLHAKLTSVAHTGPEGEGPVLFKTIYETAGN